VYTTHKYLYTLQFRCSIHCCTVRIFRRYSKYVPVLIGGGGGAKKIFFLILKVFFFGGITEFLQFPGAHYLNFISVPH
jgi:hypothetical protein